jgi:alpha-beta hydrolase superfamily lysophospholipase
MGSVGIDAYQREDHRQTAADGTSLFLRTYHPVGSAPTGHLDLIHGWSDHGGRYGRLLETLRPLNLAVRLPDLRGHGHSGGQRGHIRRLEDYLQDLVLNFDLDANSEVDPKPRWLLGHSMGALVAFHLALRWPRIYQGVILASPFLGLQPAMGIYRRVLIKLLSRIIPGLPLRRRLNSGEISHDTLMAAAYEKDPLVHGRFTPRWLNEILGAQELVRHQASAFSMPLLLQLSPDDTVVDAQAALAVYLRLPAGAKTLRVYPHCSHELYNESAAKAKKPCHDLVAWLYEKQAAALV